jgi:4-carboxymuconolactone decarboxylase
MQSQAPLEAKGAKGMHALGTILHNQALYDAWRPLARYLNSSSCITWRERELLILRTAWLCRSDYEWGNHVLVARKAGLTDTEISAIRHDAGSAVWNHREALIIRVPDELLRDARLSDKTYAALAQAYDDAQIIEILMLVGHYVMIGYLLNSAHTENDEGVLGLEYP